MHSSLLCHAVRLLPGEDLIGALKSFCHKEQIHAGCIISCVGSLHPATLRLSNHTSGTVYDTPQEILSLSGTVSTNGCHLHMGISDGHGHVYGGHVLPGCTIYTTAEVIIGALPELTFQRMPCELSGYNELNIATNSNKKDK